MESVRTPMREGGFTLVELMIVVAIIGVLAVIAAGSYRKYSAKARSAEVYAMFGEIRAKEEAYRAEFSRYCNTAASCATAANEDTFYPALLGSGEPRAKTISSATWPIGWGDLGINPGKNALYCGYVAVAGNGTSFGSAGPKGAAVLSNPTAPTGNQLWWYARATCNNDGGTAVNAFFLTASNTTAVVVENEGR